MEQLSHLFTHHRTCQLSQLIINKKRLSLWQYKLHVALQEQQGQSIISYLFIPACEPSEITNTYINLY